MEKHTSYASNGRTPVIQSDSCFFLTVRGGYLPIARTYDSNSVARSLLTIGVVILVLGVVRRSVNIS
jgi:hypothetical protein